MKIGEKSMCLCNCNLIKRDIETAIETLEQNAVAILRLVTDERGAESAIYDIAESLRDALENTVRLHNNIAFEQISEDSENKESEDNYE